MGLARCIFYQFIEKKTRKSTLYKFLTPYHCSVNYHYYQSGGFLLRFEFYVRMNNRFAWCQASRHRLIGTLTESCSLTSLSYNRGTWKSHKPETPWFDVIRKEPLVGTSHDRGMSTLQYRKRNWTSFMIKALYTYGNLMGAIWICLILQRTETVACFTSFQAIHLHTVINSTSSFFF